MRSAELPNDTPTDGIFKGVAWVSPDLITQPDMISVNLDLLERP